MSTRPFEGGALLVAGYRPGARRAGNAAALLGQLAETLQAAPGRWWLRRLSPIASGRFTPSRAHVRQQVDELVTRELDALLIVIVGEIVGGAQPALLTGGAAGGPLDEMSVPFAWLRERVEAARAAAVAMIVSACTDDADAHAHAWLDALRTDRATHTIAVARAGRDPSIGELETQRAGPGTVKLHAGTDDPLLTALLAGLTGGAHDPGTGTVTLRSLGEHLRRAVPAVALQPSPQPDTLAAVAPLGGPWRASGAWSRTRSTDVTDEDLSGVVLPGRFRLDAVIGSGGFGTVYRARQLTVDRDVAIKVLHAGIDPGSDEGRLFLHEIQSVGRIDHANVVRIYQADSTADTRLFFAMELLGGRDLQRVVDSEGPLAQERALALTGQLLAGLAAAHDAGLVHADIKPGNVIVVGAPPDERVVLIDFGLSRLRRADQDVESLGGTPAYMAPEQLRDGRVDARSDLFAVALVLVRLLTGWEREDLGELVPPLDGITDPRLRDVLSRALAIDPSERYPTAAAFAHALAGAPDADAPPPPLTRSPFRHLAPFTEADVGRLHGRERDLAALTEQLLVRAVLVYAAPSGAGKTSLLRAGLVPRLTALHTRAVYVVCRPGCRAELLAAIDPAAIDLADALARWQRTDGGRLVIVVDQVEALLTGASADAGDAGELLAELVDSDRWPPQLDASVVLSVRDDFLGRLLAAEARLQRGVPVLRLRPLGREGARAAIVEPLAERRIAIAPDLLEHLLDDLVAAGAALAAEMGWGTGDAVYPPHLQLACSVLYDALAPDAATLTLADYRRLGGFEAIVGEYLDRVLVAELDAASARIARDLFVELVTAAHTRAFRTEAELLARTAGRHGEEAVRAVIAALCNRGLVVRVRGQGGESGLELVHDSLVPRIERWIDSRDLAGRRAVELVRHHLLRSEPAAPSLLSRTELRELRAHREAVAALDDEWAHRDVAWTPARLIARSRQLVRRRLAAIAAAVALVAIAGAVVIASWLAERDRRRHEQVLSDRDLGRFTLELRLFDWDVANKRPIAVAFGDLPKLTWELRVPDSEDRTSPGAEPLPHVRRVHTSGPGLSGPFTDVEAPGRAAFLIVDGRWRPGTPRCAPSIVPIQDLPGYVDRARPRLLAVHVPTCDATRADMIDIPAGPFLESGPGWPPVSAAFAAELEPVHESFLPGFAIDRTEVTNAGFAVLGAMAEVTGIDMPEWMPSPQLVEAWRPDRPAVQLTWTEARAYCRFVGKQLPTASQWNKAMRGGLTLPDGSRNPHPDRNFPWGTEDAARANVGDRGPSGRPGLAPVEDYAGDVSPYGVRGMAGNANEWTDSVPMEDGRPVGERVRVTRGGNWVATTANLIEYMVADNNPRTVDDRDYGTGFRCAAGATPP